MRRERRKRNLPGFGRSQRGFLGLVLLAILIPSALYALLKSANATTAEYRRHRAEVTQRSLNEAKQALIAWSALHANGPGHLLCPDTDNDGDANTISCGTAATRVGRLPWKTLGLPDLRDASGERLWYAVSRCFLERAEDVYCTYKVNSSTEGQLEVQGTAPASRIVAIIFAPGAAFLEQDRSGAGVNSASNYLEGLNVPASANPCELVGTVANPATGKLDCTDVFESRTPCFAASECGGNFNDQVIVITRDDLFNVVEPVVAKRIENEIKPQLAAHAAAWGGYLPFAAPFVDPSFTAPNDMRRTQNDYRGRGSETGTLGAQPGQSGGLLPVTAQSGWVAWASTALATIGGVDTSISCAPADSDTDGVDDVVRCDVAYTAANAAPQDILVTATLRNAGRAFVQAVTNATFTVPFPLDATAPFQSPAQKALGLVAVNARSLAATCAGSSVVPMALTAAGDAIVRLCMNVQSPAGAGLRAFTVQMQLPAYEPAFTDSSAAGTWFTKNAWYSVTYYAVSPARLPGGSGTACAVADCLSVTSTTGQATTNAAEALLVLGGRNLAPSARTSWNVADFFEGENASSPQSFDVDTRAMTPVPDSTFRRDLRGAAFNDRIVQVLP
jgi:hypothetical protein